MPNGALYAAQRSVAQYSNAKAPATTNKSAGVVSRSATIQKNVASTAKVNSVSRSGDTDEPQKQTTRRAKLANNTVRGRTGMLGGTISGVGGGITSGDGTRVNLLIPDELVDVYPKLGSYIAMSGNKKIGDNWVISMLNHKDFGLPDLKTLFTNIKYRGGKISGGYTKSSGADETVYTAKGTVENTNINGDVYIESPEPVEPEVCTCTDLGDGDKSCTCTVDNDKECANGSCDDTMCPHGLDNPAVRSALLGINGISADSGAAENPGAWTWRYYKVFKSSADEDESYCKLVMVDKSGTCWTNDTPKGLENTDRYSTNNLVVVDCDIDSFKTMGVAQNYKATKITVVMGDENIGASDYATLSWRPQNVQFDLYVEIDGRFPSLHNLVNALNAPTYTTTAGIKMPKVLDGIYHHNGDQFYDGEGYPLGKVLRNKDLQTLYMKWKEPAAPQPDSETGCPNPTDTIQAWKYKNNNVDAIKSLKRVVKASKTEPLANIKECAIIYEDLNGICRIAPWNTKTNKGYGSAYDSKTGDPSRPSGAIVHCDRDNSTVDAFLNISTNATGHNNTIAETESVAVNWGETLPSLSKLIELNQYFSPNVNLYGVLSHKYMTDGGKPCARKCNEDGHCCNVCGGQCNTPDNAEVYWGANGEPTQTIDNQTELDSFENNRAYMYWKTGSNSLEDCPIPADMSCADGTNNCKTGKASYNNWWLPNVKGLQLVGSVFLTNIYSHGVGDCGIKVQDADGICWLVSNNFGCQTVYGSCNATPVICDRVSSDMYDAASGKKYDDYTYIFSDDMTLYVDDDNGTITSSAIDTPMHSRTFKLFKWDYPYSNTTQCPESNARASNGSWNAPVRWPDLTGLVQNMQYSVSGKKFDGIYSQPDCKGVKYYNADGTTVADDEPWKCYGDTTCKVVACRYRDSATNTDKLEYTTTNGTADGALLQNGGMNWDGSAHNDSTAGLHTVNNLDIINGVGKMYMCWQDADDYNPGDGDDDVQNDFLIQESMNRSYPGGNWSVDQEVSNEQVSMIASGDGLCVPYSVSVDRLIGGVGACDASVATGVASVITGN